MSAKKWFINSSQSDLLIKTRHTIIAYMCSPINKFDGFIEIKDNEIEDASIEFIIDLNKKDGKLEHIDSHLNLNDFFHSEQYPTLSFKSTSFEKINSNINFLKGLFTINNITKMVELDAKISQIENNNEFSTILLEIIGNISRRDFKLYTNSNIQNSGLLTGTDINLIASIEFI